MLHKETVTPALLRLASVVTGIPELSSFRMVGGTAIALQLGHRKSIDIDFFSNEKTDKNRLRKVLMACFKSTEFFVSPDHLSAEIDGIRIELYDDWMIPFRSEVLLVEGVRLAALQDLAAFKLNAITGRREKKDYIDLYFLFKHLGVRSVLSEFKNYDPLLSPKSILFGLAEVKTAQTNQSAMPDMLMPTAWKEIQSAMIEAGKQYMEIVRRDGNA
ncbi:MAG: nucleotidyl transferase AbiEii/AbiGii toxin family protein [Cyclobacteriaceae bacterium]|nr:nucleotidyl transferase AbiEii/AbiGii toxin family protein [Cyclobacteriaceae bacterium]